MDISMDFSSINSYQKVYTGESVCKLSSDAVIPDTYEDISRLLGTEFSYKIISKDALFGKVSISGELEAVSLFVSENSDKPSSLRTVMPFTADFSCDDIDSASIPVASIKIIASDCRELNPRKIGINADAAVSVEVYNKSELNFPLAPSNAGNVFFKTEDISVNYISMVSEKLSTLDDEREADNASEIISSNTEYAYDSYELVGSRLIVKAHAHSRVIMQKANGEVSVNEFDIPFSQLFDSNENADISDCKLFLLPAGEYYELIDGVLNTELRIVSQLVCIEHKDLSCVTDAYACGFAYSLGKDEMKIISSSESSSLIQAASVSYDLPADVVNVIISSIKFGKISSTAETVNVPIVINAMYSDKDNRLFSFRVRDNVEFEKSDCMCLEPAITSSKCALIGGKAQFELQVTLKCMPCVVSSVNIISSVSVNEEEKLPLRPSLYIVRADSNDLWSISKKYAADQNRILDINAMSDDDNICGKMLIIPTI